MSAPLPICEKLRRFEDDMDFAVPEQAADIIDELYRALDKADQAFVPVGGTSTHLLCRIPIELVREVASALARARGETPSNEIAQP